MRVIAYCMALAILMPSDAHAVTPSSGGCLLVGDMVAQGLVPYTHQCAVVAKSTASSGSLRDFTPHNKYSKVYISIGSNDPLNPKLGQNLFAIRNKYKGSSITWIAPRNSRAAQRVYETAVYFHDKIIYLSKYKSSDGIQPKDYKALAKAL